MITFLFSALISNISVNAQPVLVRAVGTEFGASISNNSLHGAGNNAYFNAVFMVDSATNFSSPDLWVSDGTHAGTKTVKSSNIYSSVILNNAGGFMDFNGNLIFSTTTTSAFATTGNELWQSDGTDVGTVLVKKINTPGNGSFPGNFCRMGNNVYFTADDGSHGKEIWTSDGTNAGTTLVKDITAGSNGSQINEFSYVNGKLCFFKDQGSIWVSDGTAAGTNQVVGLASVGNSKPSVLNSTTAVFPAAATGSSDIEVWKTDGTLAGTSLIKNINSTATSSFGSYTDIGVANGNAYFLADDGINGLELWKTDGTSNGTTLVKDITAGSASSVISPMFVATSNKLFFNLLDASYNVQSIWATDGTASGTIQLLTTTTGLSTYITNFVAIGNQLLFTINDKIYKSDGTIAGTNIFYTIPNKYLSTLALANGTLFIQATDTVNFGDELWKLDVTFINGITENKFSNDDFNIYPNPSTDYLFIQSSEKIKNIKYSNYLGQTVDANFENNYIDISNLSKGIYFLNLTTLEGITITQKFIKE